MYIRIKVVISQIRGKYTYPYLQKCVNVIEYGYKVFWANRLRRSNRYILVQTTRRWV